VGGLWADYGRTVGGLWSFRRAPTLFVDMLALPCVPLDLSAATRVPLRRIDAGDVEFSLLRTRCHHCAVFSAANIVTAFPRSLLPTNTTTRSQFVIPSISDRNLARAS
jgi:hypothetical protein